MHKPLAVIALSAGMLWLTACDKTPPRLPAPMANQPAPAEPSVESVTQWVNTAQVQPVLRPSDGTSRPALEPEAILTPKPRPGKNNAHSVSLSSAR